MFKEFLFSIEESRSLGFHPSNVLFLLNGTVQVGVLLVVWFVE